MARTKRAKRGKRRKKGRGWWPWLILISAALLGAWVAYLKFSPRPSPPAASPRELRDAIEASFFEMGLGRQRVEVLKGGYRVLLPQGLSGEEVKERIIERLGALRGVEVQVFSSAEGMVLQIRCEEGTLRVELSPRRVPKPMVSVVVDDLGGDLALAEAFMDLGEPLILSLLPYEAHTREVAERAHRRGFEVLVHLPMEPKAYPLRDPGKGALLTSMGEEELREAIERGLEAVPFAKGANNHMGSRFMEKGEKVALLMEALSRRGMFFLDSLTTPRSQGKRQALAKGVRFYQRDVFLDNNRTTSGFLAQWGSLVEVAQRRGWAIGICHPYPSTLHGLSLALEEGKAELVPLRWLPPSR